MGVTTGAKPRAVWKCSDCGTSGAIRSFRLLGTAAIRRSARRAHEAVSPKCGGNLEVVKVDASVLAAARAAQ